MFQGARESVERVSGELGSQWREFQGVRKSVERVSGS